MLMRCMQLLLLASVVVSHGHFFGHLGEMFRGFKDRMEHIEKHHRQGDAPPPFLPNFPQIGGWNALSALSQVMVRNGKMPHPMFPPALPPPPPGVFSHESEAMLNQTAGDAQVIKQAVLIHKKLPEFMSRHKCGFFEKFKKRFEALQPFFDKQLKFINLETTKNFVEEQFNKLNETLPNITSFPQEVESLSQESMGFLDKVKSYLEPLTKNETYQNFTNTIMDSLQNLQKASIFDTSNIRKGFENLVSSLKNVQNRISSKLSEEKEQFSIVGGVFNSSSVAEALKSFEDLFSRSEESHDPEHDQADHNHEEIEQNLALLETLSKKSNETALDTLEKKVSESVKLAQEQTEKIEQLKYFEDGINASHKELDTKMKDIHEQVSSKTNEHSIFGDISKLFSSEAIST